MGPLWRELPVSDLHKSLVDEPPSRLPSGAPRERVAHPLSPPPHILPDHQQRSPLSGFP